MSTIVITGAAGSVGKRVVSLLDADPSVERIVAVDRDVVHTAGSKVHGVKTDVLTHDLATLLSDADSVIHLAEDQRRRSDGRAALAILNRLLSAMSEVRCAHLVLLSSAMVYGAYQDNPIPMVEKQPRRPIPEVPHATIKASLEERAEQWLISNPLSRIAIMRPTTTLSDRGVSSIAGELRKATSARTGNLLPPVQFLHHDDLASAVTLVAKRRLGGPFNVAPDGWISSTVFEDLEGKTHVGVTDTLAFQRGELLKKIGARKSSGLADYVAHPWVIANDRLREAGWIPAFSSEEAYVAGTPGPLWDVVPPNRRQEVALGIAGAACLSAAAIGARVLSRALKSR